MSDSGQPVEMFAGYTTAQLWKFQREIAARLAERGAARPADPLGGETRSQIVQSLRSRAADASRYECDCVGKPIADWCLTCVITKAADELARPPSGADAALREEHPALVELRRVVAMSLSYDKGGQPRFPGRMPPAMARHFEKLLATPAARDAAREETKP